MKNFVVVRHMHGDEKYLFLAPDTVTLDAGAMVVCETNRGDHEFGVCATGTFMADPEVICRLWATNPKAMRRVVKVMREFDLEWAEGDEGNG